MLDDESKKSSTGDDDVGGVVAAAATATAVAAAAGLPVTALRRHVPRDFGGPFQDGSLVVAMQDLSLLSLSLSLSISIFFLLSVVFSREPRRSIFLPVGSSGGPRHLLFRPYRTPRSDGRRDLETPGIVTKKDILLSQACPRISTKSLFRMHRVPFSGAGVPPYILSASSSSPSVHLVAFSDLSPPIIRRMVCPCSTV